MLFTSIVVSTFAVLVLGSSHSDAPGTSKGPRSDLTDVYSFLDANGDLVVVMNTSPLQQSQAGPNYGLIDTEFLYQIHIDNDGDAREDSTFQFMVGHQFGGANNDGLTASVNGRNVKVALGHAGFIDNIQANVNNKQYYSVRYLKGDDYSTLLDDGPFLKQGGGQRFDIPYAFAGDKTFTKAGKTSAANYKDLTDAFTYTNVDIPGCGSKASMFVGPRRESFALPLGRVFDLVNINGAPNFNGPAVNPPFAAPANLPVLNAVGVDNVGKHTGRGAAPTDTGALNSIDKFGVNSFILKIPQACVTSKSTTNKILGVWASVRELNHVQVKHHHHHDDDDDDNHHHTSSSSSSSSYVPHVEGHLAGKQTNRLGNPLVNELLIGLPDKDKFSKSHPRHDIQFLEYFEFPTLPTILSDVFKVEVKTLLGQPNPTVAPFVNIAPTHRRTDLVAVLLQGLPGINKPRNEGIKHRLHDSDKKRQVFLSNDVYADMQRINLDTATRKTPQASNCMGVIGGDGAGYPNGRRLGDDVVDITLQVAMGKLCEAGFAAFGFCKPTDAPTILNGKLLDYTDFTPISQCAFLPAFPYLNAPIAGHAGFDKLTEVAAQTQQETNVAGCPN